MPTGSQSGADIRRALAAQASRNEPTSEPTPEPAETTPDVAPTKPRRAAKSKKKEN